MYAETIVGFKRKAYVTDNQFPEDDQPFTDPSFQI